jgi:hypothetical protein
MYKGKIEQVLNAATYMIYEQRIINKENQDTLYYPTLRIRLLPNPGIEDNKLKEIIAELKQLKLICINKPINKLT